MPGSHVVTLELTSDGAVIGRPQLVMKPGDTVEAKRETPDGYSIKVTLKDPAGSGSPARDVDMQLYLPGGAGWVLAAHPVIHVGLNETSDLSFRTQSGKTIGIRLSVKKDA